MLPTGVRVITDNRRARHEYHIVERVEAGIALVGTEVKSMRMGRVNLADAYAAWENGEVILHNMHISPYDPASQFNHDPRRSRRLLLHKSEIAKLRGRVVERGFTLIPLRLYFRKNLVKVELALAKGKRLHDKRQAIAKRDREREVERDLRDRQR